jgi:multidrug efflux pump subunit AcrB
LLILIFGVLTIVKTPKDIFPQIRIPVISIVFTYSGLAPDDIANRIAAPFERIFSTVVNDISHVESQSVIGMTVIKVFFQPKANIEMAMSQITAVAQTLMRNLPPGTTPPLIITYNASTVPVLQVALSSSKMPEQDIFDFANSFMRTQLVSVQGASLPYPYGGKMRQIQIDLNQPALTALGLSAQDVSNALNNQNLILPAGTEKIGLFEYNVKLNASPKELEPLNDLPIKVVNGSTIMIRDVAHVRDGFAPQTNIVHVNGVRAVLMSIQKTGNASSLDIIKRVKKIIPAIKDNIPPGLNLDIMGDQSIFIIAAIDSVIHEGVLAAILTGLMILLFLGSWRSTLIITISIPLSILCSLIMLSALGETINIMTLGGLALAVGILVDDATVAIENINWHLEQGKPVEQAILDGAQQIAIPALVSTLCICIVFVPMFTLQGISYYLFVPLAEAVVFAMLASYMLSRTVIPTLAKYLLQEHRHKPTGDSFYHRFQAAFEHGFETLRQRYKDLLTQCLHQRKRFVITFLGFVVVSLLVLGPWIGSDFFPSVDAGQIKLHMRAHTGMRVEETARMCSNVDSYIRSIIPKDEVVSILDNIGLPISGINLSYSNSAPIGPGDADILITLSHDHHSTFDYIKKLRAALPKAFPNISFSFLPADMVSQILNFGLPAPIDIQIMGFNPGPNHIYINKLFEQIRHVPGIVDSHVQQALDNPEFHLSINRFRAQELGLTTRDVANNMLIGLSGSFQTAPAFWLNPNGVTYSIVTQIPQYNLTSLPLLENIPISGSSSATPQILGGVVNIERGAGPGVVSHYDVKTVFDIFASVQGRDLGSVAADINKILAKNAKDIPKGATVVTRGQVMTMLSSFSGLFTGLIFAIVLVYLLIVINFQSWTDPFIIITALPGAIAGIAWMLFLSHTTLSVPALIGSIMCMGVATANSILIVSFARERMSHGDSAFCAALNSGFTRLRPVMMTALAMIIGMIPMALGLGEGGEQNAPLGRAVIGGLLFATVATLFFVPAVFCLIHGRDQDQHSHKEDNH